MNCFDESEHNEVRGWTVTGHDLGRIGGSLSVQRSSDTISRICIRRYAYAAVLGARLPSLRRT